MVGFEDSPMIRTTYPGGTKKLQQPITFVYEEGHSPRHALLNPFPQEANETITGVVIDYERHNEVPTQQTVTGPSPVIESAAIEAVKFAEKEASFYKTRIVRIYLPTVQFLDDNDLAGLVDRKYPVSTGLEPRE